MQHPSPGGRPGPLERFAQRSTAWSGSSRAFLAALGLTALWLASGPVFHFSDTWQLVMNTVSSIVTFLMVFLIQRAQNKDALAIQVKLNEIIAATATANNRIIDVEDLSEAEVRALHERYERLAERVREEGVSGAVSIDPCLGADAGRNDRIRQK
jgi:low affinity Fe/Cu permease